VTSERPAVIVTGGAGYVGSHVAKALFARGYMPVTLDDLSLGHKWAVRRGPLFRADFADRSALDAMATAHRPLLERDQALGLFEFGRGLRRARDRADSRCA
jgi:nucleoside-diphosphate-sugar epimerase